MVEPLHAEAMDLFAPGYRLGLEFDLIFQQSLDDSFYGPSHLHGLHVFG